MIERKLRAAQAYIERGWKIFVVSAEKRPVRNCKKCNEEVHDAESCACLTCHGFYAATDQVRRVRAMLHTVAEGMLAVRTGAVSGVIALDAEGDDKDGYGQTGLEILDEAADWGMGELGDTLRAASAGGGVHLLYAYQQSSPVNSRNRVLPNVDIKADGGYIVVPPGGGRGWLNYGTWPDRLAVPGDALLAFMTSGPAPAVNGMGGNGKASNGSGTFSSLRTSDVIPAGSRYEFTRDLVYMLRRRGYGWEEAVKVCEGYWARYEQPPAGVRAAGGVWYLPFTQVMYELTRVWQRVEIDKPLSFTQMAWAKKVSGSGSAEE